MAVFNRRRFTMKNVLVLVGVAIAAMSLSCKPSSVSSEGATKSVQVANRDAGGTFDPSVAKCALDSEGSAAKVYWMGNRGLYEAGRIPHMTKFWFVQKFTGPTPQKGEFWKIKFSEESIKGMVYVHQSQLACKNDASQGKCWAPRANAPGAGHWTQTASSDKSPVNIRKSDSNGRIITTDAGIVAKLENDNDVELLSSQNMNAQDGYIGIEPEAYIKTVAADGSDLLGSNFGNCRQ
jgi:hypothetical protein